MSHTEEDRRTYCVVRNSEEQYSIWQASRAPAATAVWCGPERLSYAELGSRRSSTRWSSLSASRLPQAGGVKKWQASRHQKLAALSWRNP